jgi:hypothetical protein
MHSSVAGSKATLERNSTGELRKSDAPSKHDERIMPLSVETALLLDANMLNGGDLSATVG